MNLTSEQITHYYATRLDPFRFRHSKGTDYRSQCPLHGGNNVSAMSIDCNEGKYFCFGCGEGGKSVFSFEMAMQKLETGSVPEQGIVQSAIAAVLGVPLTERIHTAPVGTATGKGWDRSRAQARYIYTDELGEEMFSVWRFVDRSGKKATPPDQPCKCSPDSECPNKCENGRYWGSKGVRRVLYRLPDVIQSSLVFVVEGEKNTDDLSRQLAGYIREKKGFQFGRLTVDRVGVTTNPGGASAWKQEYGYGKYFQGKVVVKLGDNDGPGRKHDEDACNDIARYAHSLYTLPLPVDEGEDVSDFLSASGLSAFLKLLPGVVAWNQPKPHISTVVDDLAPRQLLVKPSQLVLHGRNDDGDWLIPRLIKRGTRGLIIAPPKTGKSLLFCDVALALGTMGSFLNLPRYGAPVRIGLISREDGPEIVQERLYALGSGRNLASQDIDRYIRVNTVAQSARFKVDIDADLHEMADWLKSEEIEFAVIDVLNKLHGGEENNSNDMTKVMNKFDELAARSGAQICVIHHTNKAGGTRGSSAIEGWADWILRLEADPNDESLKTLTVRTKSTGIVIPKQIRYWQSDDLKTSKINMVIPR